MSLLRCKSVCKLWNLIISDQHFIKSHYTLSTKNINYAHHHIVYNTVFQINLNSCPLYDVLFDKTVKALDHGYSPLQRTIRPALSLVGSCNGLVCINLRDDTVDTLFVYNPSTRIWNRVPYSGFKMSRGWYVLYSFGYDEGSDDYKIVGISRCYQNRAKKDNKAKIYSLKSGDRGGWKDIDDFPCAFPLLDSAKFVNGALHWLARLDFRSDPWTIVSFDLGTETYGEVLQPVYDDGDKELTLGVLGEWLCVLCNYGANHADVWVMKVYRVKDSWTKLVSIPYLTDPGRDRYSVPLFISNDGKILVQLGSELVVYDSKDTSSFVIQDFDVCFQACTIVESLVSPSEHFRHGC